MRNSKSLDLFHFFSALACERAFIKTHSNLLKVELLKDQKIYRLQACGCTSQPGNFTGWGSEGVKDKSGPLAMHSSYSQATAVRTGKRLNSSYVGYVLRLSADWPAIDRPLPQTHRVHFCRVWLLVNSAASPRCIIRHQALHQRWQSRAPRDQRIGKLKNGPVVISFVVVMVVVVVMLFPVFFFFGLFFSSRRDCCGFLLWWLYWLVLYHSASVNILENSVTD